MSELYTVSLNLKTKLKKRYFAFYFAMDNGHYINVACDYVIAYLKLMCARSLYRQCLHHCEKRFVSVSCTKVL